MSFSEKESHLAPGYKPGRFRAYFSTKLSPAVVAKATLVASDYKYLVVVLAVAAVVRTFRLYSPSKVIFDETHFGGFAQDYYHGEFFVDVHPPLVKLIFYWIGLLFGWNGQFDFEAIGDAFDDNVPYVAMRCFSAVCGIVTAVSTFLALRASGCRVKIAGIGALLVIFENSLATQSRLIMLDSGLVAFTSLSVLSFQKFQVAQPFSRKWFQKMLATGVALGLTVSTKLTGLFTLLWVLIWTSLQVWAYIGDLEVTIKELAAHVVCRLVAFIVVPATIYCGIFSVHFMSLPFNGPGSGIMSPSFKAGLADSDNLRNTAVDVSYGSTVTIKHHRLDEYLHSHDSRYKSGSGEQQVSMYGFGDDANNEWVLETHGTNYDGKLDTKFRPIMDGDTVKLYHKATKKYLRANDVRPPNSEHDYSNEVSCHGNRTDTADINYEWKVDIVGKKPHSENDLPLRKLRATETVFQLFHRGTHCKLVGHDVKLPDWAFNQNQVLCISGPTVPNTLWYVENNHHPVIDNDVETYPRVKLPQLSLLWKIAEYHRAMWRTNQGFTKKHDYASTPLTWPLVLRGINYFSNGHGNERLTDENGSHIYLLGNIVVYYGGLVALAIVGVKLALYVLGLMNPFKQPSGSGHESASFFASLQYASGWALHFVPYWFMTRQLFAHHYLTSVLFLILTMSQFVEASASRSRGLMSALWLWAYGAYAIAAVAFFVKFSPLVYGLGWTVAQCQAAKLLPGWDFDCMAYSH
ncbi:hypothetical protein JCM33374_g3303 [Metschnikowia sp. JCM 33374]|nr:hypothetical protein JCM33374_g3303 [Metschnikowia sp. JCM 33374]